MRSISIILGLLLIFSTYEKGDDFAIELEDLFVKRNLVRDERLKFFYEGTSTDNMIWDMGFGWNLGNTFDAFIETIDHNQGLTSETSWGNPYTTLEMIKTLVKKEVKTIRIPVTWHNHLIDDHYTIDPLWMKRVKTVVDWAINNGMYVILGTAHDNTENTEWNANLRKPISYGQGYYPTIKDAEESERFLYNVWRQISIAFNNGYDNHLIFEGLSDPSLVGTLYEYSFDRKNEECLLSAKVINEYNALILKAIRDTGGNNLKRFVLITPYGADIDALYDSDFAFPDDSKYNPRSERLLLSLHYYNPAFFTRINDLDFFLFEDAYKERIEEDFLALYNTYVKKGFHVIITAFGTINKGNVEERIKWADFFIRTSRKYHLGVVYWDNGKFAKDDVNSKTETAQDSFSLLHRDTLKWESQGYINTLIKRCEEYFPVEYDAFQITLRQYFNKKEILLDEGVTKPFNDSITGRQVADEIGLGWSLGNTFDCYIEADNIVLNAGVGTETLWGNPETTEEMIKTIAKKGISTIKIPVSWHNHIDDQNYTIDKKWMERIKTVVDWCIKYGLYVIIDSHHDNHLSFEKGIRYGQGYYPLYRNAAESEKFLYNIWTQIALAFNNGYDHHLIFQTLNEPRLAGYTNEWVYDRGDKTLDEAIAVLNEYNRLIVKAIRETGGNNEKRFILLSPYGNDISSAMNSLFEFPDDTKYNPTNTKLMLSMHLFVPYEFTLVYDWHNNYFGTSGKKEVYDSFNGLYAKYVSQGYQVVVTGVGAVNKKNMAARVEWARYFTYTGRLRHISSIIWDNGIFFTMGSDNGPTGDYLGEFHRDTLKWDNEDMIDAYLEGSHTKFLD